MAALERSISVVLILWPLLIGAAWAGAPPQASAVLDRPPAGGDESHPAQHLAGDTDAEPLPLGLGLSGWPLSLNEPPPVVPTLPAPDAPQRAVWDGTPIRVALTVGQERMVHFPGEVRVGFRGGAPTGLRTQSVAGTVYWLAETSFAPVRVTAQLIDSGRILLLDLLAETADDRLARTPLQVLIPPPAGQDSAAADAGPPSGPSYVQLTRFAARQLYGPPRLAGTLAGVGRVPLRPGAVALLRGARVLAEPLAGWRGGELYVTAVRLRNITRSAVLLDPRELRGQWLTATFQHARLWPAGDEADTSCVYLISARPFHAALGGYY